jgi:hypothetical protein
MIRRISNIFKKRLSALAIYAPNMGRIYESSQGSPTDDKYDIRRPSGLASTASISSLPPPLLLPPTSPLRIPYGCRAPQILSSAVLRSAHGHANPFLSSQIPRALSRISPSDAQTPPPLLQYVQEVPPRLLSSPNMTMRLPCMPLISALGLSGIGSLSARNFDGHGIRVIVVGDKGKGDVELSDSLSVKYED